MHLHTIELFCEVAARRSFSKAAAASDVSQSAASQAVHILERRLGATLIDRSQRPLALTRAGEVYFDGCRELLDGFRQVEDRVRGMKNTLSGRLRVAAIYSAGLSQMKADVKRFEGMYPDVDVRVDYLHPDEVYERVLADDADLGIVSFPRDGGEISSIPWQQQRLVLVVPPSHPLGAKGAVAVEEIDGEDFVAFTSELTVRRQIDRWLRGAKVAVHVNHEFDNIENIKRAVEAGTGLAILPEPTVQREVEQGLLAIVELKAVEWFRPLGIVHKRHKTLSNVAERFVELLRHGFNGHSQDRESRRPPRGNGRDKPDKKSKRPSRRRSASANR